MDWSNSFLPRLEGLKAWGVGDDSMTTNHKKPSSSPLHETSQQQKKNSDYVTYLVSKKEPVLQIKKTRFIKTIQQMDQ